MGDVFQYIQHPIGELEINEARMGFATGKITAQELSDRAAQLALIYGRRT